jgi:hypothetical protein
VGLRQLGHFQALQPARRQVFLHHRLGHVAPAQAFLQQDVFRPQIRQPPGVGAGDGEVAPVGQARAVGQDELGVSPARARRVRPVGQRVVGRGDRDQQGVADADVVQLVAAVDHVQRPGDA